MFWEIAIELIFELPTRLARRALVRAAMAEDLKRFLRTRRIAIASSALLWALTGLWFYFCAEFRSWLYYTAVWGSATVVVAECLQFVLAGSRLSNLNYATEILQQHCDRLRASNRRREARLGLATNS
jgi:hypothetical protein